MNQPPKTPEDTLLDEVYSIWYEGLDRQDFKPSENGPLMQTVRLIQKKYHEGELKGKIKQTQRIRQHRKDIHGTCYYDDFFKEEVKLLKYRLEDVK